MLPRAQPATHLTAAGFSSGRTPWAGTLAGRGRSPGLAQGAAPANRARARRGGDTSPSGRQLLQPEIVLHPLGQGHLHLAAAAASTTSSSPGRRAPSRAAAHSGGGRQLHTAGCGVRGTYSFVCTRFHSGMGGKIRRRCTARPSDSPVRSTSMAEPFTVLVMAAGQGTRMQSKLPKVLHPVCGKPDGPVGHRGGPRGRGADGSCASRVPATGSPRACPTASTVAEQTEGEGTGGAILAARERRRRGGRRW